MTKSTTKKKKVVKKPAPPEVFNLLSGPPVLADVEEALHAMRARRKNDNTTLRSLHQIKRNGFPIEHFYLQYALGLAYIPSRCMVEIIGAEGIGKSTFIFTLLGMAGRANVPSLYQETEAKPMMEDQIKRCLSPNVELAESLFDRAVHFADGREIRQVTKLMDEWVFTIRGRSGDKVARVPAENPVVVAIDTWSKLMSPIQAAGYMDHGDFMKADQVKNLKEVGEGSNLEHAKHAAWWCRRLPYLLSEYNALLFIVSHQNAKIDMGGGASYMSAEAGRLYNKTKIGGKAFDQNAAIQIILGSVGQAKNGSGETTGRMVRLRVDKNSFGPDNRIIDYELRNVYTDDTAVYREPAIQFDAAMAKWFADKRILNTTADKKRYTCEALSVIGGSAEDLSKALHANYPMMARLAKDLAIRGYDETEDIVDVPKADAPSVEAPAETEDAEAEPSSAPA